MPGFEFRYRIGGGQPTTRRFLCKNTETLTAGDMLTFDDGQVGLAAHGNRTLLGSALETLAAEAGKTAIEVITDADAVYGIDDPHARRRGDTLDLTGPTGAQGVAASPASEFTVVADSAADQETLVRISPGSHHQVSAMEGLGRRSGGDLNAAVARAVVRFHRAEMGRGPNKARAFYRDDIIVVVLEDLMTQAERRLVERGQHDAVIQMRAAFQKSMRADLVTVIEELTGTKVRAFMSSHSNNLDPDMAVLTFVLDEPISGNPSPGPDDA
jgi:uncharacterized protein YbcI